MKNEQSVIAGLALVISFITGCKHQSPSFEGHTLGETFAQFSAIEHPDTETDSDTPFTGQVDCFEPENYANAPVLGAACKAHRQNFDNAHFTFVDNKLVGIESVGDGGIIGDKAQFFNWSRMLRILPTLYGKPDSVTPAEALWTRHDYVVHAFLTQRFNQLLNYPSGGMEQIEHAEILTRSLYDRTKH